MHERKDFTWRLLTLRVFRCSFAPMLEAPTKSAVIARGRDPKRTAHHSRPTGERGGRKRQPAKYECGMIARSLRTLEQPDRTPATLARAPGSQPSGIGPSGISAGCSARQRPLERHRVLLEALLVAKTWRLGGRHLTTVRGAKHARVVEFTTHDPFLDARRGAIDDGVNVVGRALQLALRNAAHPRWVVADTADTSQTDHHGAQRQQQAPGARRGRWGCCRGPCGGFFRYF